MSILKLSKTVTTVTVTPILALRLDSLDILSVNPLADDALGALLLQSMFQSECLQLRQGKHIGQKLQQILRSTLRTSLGTVHFLRNHITKETHLAPQVVTLAPADKVINLDRKSVV